MRTPRNGRTRLFIGRHLPSLRVSCEGVEDYYMGAGEAPRVWRERWADALGLDGSVSQVA
jgi:hypothetical protein